MRNRDFDVAVEEMRANRPVFHLGGRDWTCRPALSFAAMATMETQTKDQSAQESLLTFFDKVLIKSDRQPFRDLVLADEDDDDAVPVTAKQLSDISQWLMESYTGSPTPSSGDSSPGGPNTGQPLKIVSLDAVSATPVTSVG